MSIQREDAGSGFPADQGTGGQAAAAAHAKDAPWRVYASIDKALETDEPPVMPKIEKTCRELDRLAHSGDTRDAERARAALAGYGRALELYRHLTELRDKAISESVGGSGRRNA